MKELLFTHGKQVALRFETEHMEFEQQVESILLTGEGEITAQDMPSVEAMFAEYPCQLTVTENGEELLNGRFLVTLLLLEPNQIAARLRVE